MSSPSFRKFSNLVRSFSSSSSASSASYPHHQFSPHLPIGLSQFNDFITESASGSWVTGKNGRRYLDWMCGIGVTNLGHCHPKVNQAAIKQIEKGVHLQVNCLSHQPMIDLAKKLGKYLPPNMKDNHQVLFSNSGAESIENAVKLSRIATKRQTVIVFQGGFHGRTIATGALTTAKYVYRAGFQPTMSGVHVVPFPYCSRCPCTSASSSQCCNEPIVQLKNCLKQQTSVDEVAAILIEPILGEGGYVLPPPGFLKQVQKVANDIGALLIADEVQTGFGRTGEMFAWKTFDFHPDIVVMAKGIANGFPLSGIATHASILSKAKPGSIGGTYGGNVVGCAAANAVLDVFEEENILHNVKERGEQLRNGLYEINKKYPNLIKDIRGVGLMNAVEFNDTISINGEKKTEAWSSLLTKKCLENGLMILSAGIHESLRIIPPLNITKQDMDTGLQLLEKSIKQVFKL